MNNNLELFDDLSAYSIDSLEAKHINISNIFSFGILMDGINDIQLLTNKFQEKTSLKIKTIKIYNNLVFILFDTGVEYFNKKIKQELFSFCQSVHSIFLKKHLIDNNLCKFDDIDEKFFYIYYEEKQIITNDNYQMKKVKDIKISSTHPNERLYGFDNYTDMIEFYAEILNKGKNWPVFAIWPTKVKYSQTHIKPDDTNNNNNLIYDENIINKNKPKNNKNSDTINHIIKREEAEVNRKQDNKNITNKKKENISFKPPKLDDTSQYIVDLKDYKKLQSGIIGSGSYGTVFLVENIHNHKKYAAKVKLNDCKNYEDFIQEIKFYTSVKYSTILSLHGYSMKNFENEPKPTLLLEYMPNNSLANLLQKPHKFIESIISKKFIILWGIIWAMIYLHQKGIVHRDLKPSNILLDENYYPRVSDFGSSIMYNDIDQLKKKYEQNVGTPMYMAPEIFQDDKPYSFKVDVYSFAMIAYEVLTEVAPFSEKKFKTKNQLIKNVIDGVRPDLSIIHDIEIRDFFGRCWSSEPFERPTFLEILRIFDTPKFKKVFHCNDDEYMMFSLWNIENSEEMKKQGLSIFTNSELKHYKSMVLLSKGLQKEYMESIKKVADEKDVKGMYIYGKQLIESSNQYDQQKANFYLKKSADLGFDQAMIEYGNRLLKGLGTDKNPEEALRYFKMAADQGCPAGMLNYGIALLDAKGNKDNLKEAAAYFQLSADLGLVNGMFLFAKMLQEGNGIKRDTNKAAKYYEKAVMLGDVEAMSNLGKMYFDGSLQVDFKKASHYLKMAAKHGFVEAMFNYGNLLCKIADDERYSDDKKERFYEKAAKYYNDAANKGNSEAASQYQKLLNKKNKHSDNSNSINNTNNSNINNNNNANISNKSNINKNTSKITANDNDDFLGQILEQCANRNYSIFETVLYAAEILTENNDKLIKKGDKYYLKKDIHSFNEIDELDDTDNSKSKFTHKNINEVKLKSYKPYELFHPDYICISQFTISDRIREEIDKMIQSYIYFKCFFTNIIHQRNPDDIYTFYYFVPKFDNSCVRKKIFKIMMNHRIESFSSNIRGKYFHFNELYIQDDVLNILFKYFETSKDVIGVKRNVFDGSQIATYIINKIGTDLNLLKSIRNLLTQQGILFKSFEYPLQNDIIIYEKMIFHDKNDFDAILNEIKTMNYNPIYVERDALYMYDYYCEKKLFQRFSFICFKNEIEKMEVVNHLNSILFIGKNNVLQYNIELHYASINDHSYHPKIRELIPKLFYSFKGVKDYQSNVVSFESPIAKTYIGFDSLKHLKKCHYKFMYKLNILLYCDEPNLFWRKKELNYIYIRSKDKFSVSSFNKYIKIISNLFEDIQINCTDLVDASPEKFKQVYSNYIGFINIDKMNEARMILVQNPMPNRSDLTIDVYKEGNSNINISDEAKELYLFYESL